MKYGIHTYVKKSYSGRRKIMSKTCIPKKLLLSVAAILCILAVSGISYGGNIIVKPGKFDHFSIQMPEKVRAGEGFMVRLQAYDAHENLITDFAETGKDFKISVSGSAQVQPSVLKAVSFTGGAGAVSIMDKKAESVTLSISEAGGTVSVVTKEIVVSPNKLDHFFIQSPQTVTAGNNFDVKIIAKDAFDNAITDAEIEGTNIKITSSGTAGVKTVNAAPVFRNGVNIATLMAEKTGEISIEVQDTSTGSRGVSSGVKVLPAVLSYFKVYAPKEAVAGEPFEVTVNAFDAFDNAIDNYASYGNGVNITSTGLAKLAPSFISQSEFRNGQAVVKLKYEKAEEISIITTENNKSQQGKSTSVRINPAAPDNFVAVTPETAVAGQKFRVKVEVYDRFNNMVKNYNLVGNDVYLNVSGTGILSPKVVSASEFINGIASVDVTYDKAESFTISASMATKREEKAITLKEHKAESKVPEAVKAPERPSVQKATEKTEKSEKHATAAKVEKAVVSKRTEKTEPVKEAENKEALKDKKHGEKFFEVKKVSIIEAKNKAMVIINMKASEANIEYKEFKESINGKSLIKVSLKPAINRTKKLWKFKSAFVKEINLEEDKSAGALIVKIETLSNLFTFDVNRVKDSIVISIASPNQ